MGKQYIVNIPASPLAIYKWMTCKEPPYIGHYCHVQLPKSNQQNYSNPKRIAGLTGDLCEL